MLFDVIVQNRKFQIMVYISGRNDHTTFYNYVLNEIIEDRVVLLSNGLTYGSEAFDSTAAEAMEDIAQRLNVDNIAEGFDRDE